MEKLNEYACKTIVGGNAVGKVLVADTKLSFWGEFDPITGEVIIPGHPFFQNSLKGKILLMREIKGSSGVEASLRLAKKMNTAPAAIVNINIDPLAVLACVVAKIPLLKGRDDMLQIFSKGDQVEIYGAKEIIKY